MIYQHGGIALNLFRLKAIKKQVTGRDGYLIFEFHNMVRVSETSHNSNVWEENSYENAPVSQYYDNLADLELYYEEWVNTWSLWTEFVVNLEMPIDFEPNSL
ncbi:hypothetical protein [Epilithonimonas hispanica]|uniref:Uncharacterized protein n=1 Tax=Epilithonimonas hispanica TaxID=358687 RepID=A0A3D9CWK0_9FLAO|nr:hypothetical protein [Epilithonimonas hispanica]REC70018.1 hypothetical protein DRF58_10890 [Epilithonimonas hispanica]